MKTKKGISIGIGDTIKCNCGKSHKWGGYADGDNRNGIDNAGWQLFFDAAHPVKRGNDMFIKYNAVCPICRN